MHNSRKELGTLSEDFVADYLTQKGFTVHSRNFRKRIGEVDIIAAKGDVIAFVEVKARTHNYFALSEVITKPKQRKIILTAKHFIIKNRLHDKVIRFDVALLQKRENGFEIKYIENAFNETD